MSILLIRSNVRKYSPPNLWGRQYSRPEASLAIDVLSRSCYFGDPAIWRVHPSAPLPGGSGARPLCPSSSGSCIWRFEMGTDARNSEGHGFPAPPKVAALPWVAMPFRRHYRYRPRPGELGRRVRNLSLSDDNANIDVIAVQDIKDAVPAVIIAVISELERRAGNLSLSRIGMHGSKRGKRHYDVCECFHVSGPFLRCCSAYGDDLAVDQSIHGREASCLTAAIVTRFITICSWSKWPSPCGIVANRARGILSHPWNFSDHLRDYKYLNWRIAPIRSEVFCYLFGDFAKSRMQVADAISSFGVFGCLRPAGRRPRQVFNSSAAKQETQ